MKTKTKPLAGKTIIIRLVPLGKPKRSKRAERDPLMIDVVRSVLEDANPEAMLADGHEAALIGTAARCSKAPLAVYSVRKLIAGLVKKGLEEEEAYEHFSFNIEGAWAGEGTPLFLVDYLEELNLPDPDMKIEQLKTAVRKAALVLAGEDMTKKALTEALEACRDALMD